jgi:hypothetical protein
MLGAITLNVGRMLSGFRFDVTLVHAQSGDVLAFLRMWAVRDASGRSVDHLAEMFRDALRPVRLPQPPQK